MAANDIINVMLFGKEVGRIGLNENDKTTTFQYNPDFLDEPDFDNIFPATGIIKRIPFPQVFGKYNNETFKGLPPQIADSLPDMFGNLIFKTWLESSDKTQKDITILEQLAYIANRGMGALEFQPSKKIPKRTTIDLSEIIAILNQVMEQKLSIGQKKIDSKALLNIFKIGTSAGGARPKILISKHKKTKKIIPGDLEYSDKYDHLLVKLSLNDELGYSPEIIEYCYYLTARKLGIRIMESHLIDDKHFATERYDRQNGQKLHCLTATGLTGWDFRSAEFSSYENLFELANFLKISHREIEELYKRMVFNLVFHNNDDHLKNHTFIYDREKYNWSMSPAYDLTYPMNPLLNFTKVSRALSINGKRQDINLEDLLKFAEEFTIKNPKGVIREVISLIPFWERQMDNCEVPQKVTQNIKSQFKAEILSD